MKKITFIAIAFLGLLACGGGADSSGGEMTSSNESSAEGTASEGADLKGMEMIDLTPYDVYASIYIPGASKGKPEITNTDWGVEIVVGKNYGVEVAPSGMTVAEKKEELANDLVYTIEYIEDAPDKIVYKKIIKEMAEDSDSYKPEFHFFMNVDVEGEVYEVKSLNHQYKESAIKKMVLSAESLSVSAPA